LERLLWRGHVLRSGTTAGFATTYNGSAWSTPSDIDSTRSVNAVSCTSSTFCVAVGASGYAAIYTGSWASASDVDSSRSIDAVDCVSTTFCVTGDTAGYSAKYTGTWATATDIDSTRSIATIACTSSTFCVTGDTTGFSAKYTGSWATATDIDSSRSIKRVACVSSSFCLTIEGSGYSAKYSGSWAAATDIDGSTALESLVCISSSDCLASDASGNVFTYTSSWSVATDVDMARSISSISCPTTTFCAAVDASGYITLYAPVVIPPVVSQLTWDTNGPLALVLGDINDNYVYGPSSSPVEEIRLVTSTPTYLTYSASNSTWLSTNEAGDQTGFYGFDAFGNLAFGTPTSAFGYAGQYSDATSGFSDLRARFYDSQDGSFTTRDPDFASTDTAYAYVGGDPVNGGDPSGLCFLGGSWCNGIQNAIASTFDYYRHETAALGDFPANVILSTGYSIYHAYNVIYQTGGNSCGFLNPTNGFFSSHTQGLVLAAVYGDESAALLGDGEGEMDALGAAGGARADFVANKSGIVIPTSRASLEGGFERAGFPSDPSESPGTEYTLPDGSRVRVMEPAGDASLQATFENANGGPINPFTGKPVPNPSNLAPAERLEYIRSLTHINLGP
jgi:RHS repeat-associated protein